MDKDTVMDIIASALDKATKGKVEKIITDPVPKEGTMTSDKFGELAITRESLISALLEDPRVISAEYKDGQCHITTPDGKISFNFKFGDESSGGDA